MIRQIKLTRNSKKEFLRSNRNYYLDINRNLIKLFENVNIIGLYVNKDNNACSISHKLSIIHYNTLVLIHFRLDVQLSKTIISYIINRNTPIYKSSNSTKSIYLESIDELIDL